MLPVLPVPAPQNTRSANAPTPKPWPRPSPAREPAARLRVLIIEDQVADVELELNALRESGVDPQSDVVQDEEHFLEQVRKQSYDVVLADYNLPQWSGIEAVELLRREHLTFLSSS